MKNKDTIIGFLIGIIAALIGSGIFLLLFTDIRSIEGLQFIRQQNLSGKVITLGAIASLISFFVLLKMHKEEMARGVLLAMIILALLTVLL
ncbi:hypothetical protein [Flavobacterium cerinum]|uniref:DUF4064 domain-containing protein n=1 Tax=Flavobacterium cerinum TaxID=2502784 RepID=A0ABY5IUI5_9FLAO|nr:hypothetical protein [Flavobacterium cerinum]UUC45832.1 hypothetical protein NOX80_01190 [Flavobacterium cerinum]